MVFEQGGVCTGRSEGCAGCCDIVSNPITMSLKLNCGRRCVADNDLTPNASVIPGMGLEYGLPDYMLKQPESKCFSVSALRGHQRLLRLAQVRDSAFGKYSPGVLR